MPAFPPIHPKPPTGCTTCASFDAWLQRTSSIPGLNNGQLALSAALVVVGVLVVLLASQTWGWVFGAALVMIGLWLAAGNAYAAV